MGQLGAPHLYSEGAGVGLLLIEVRACERRADSSRGWWW